MAKETKPDQNANLASFVDALTPQPKVITEDFIDFRQLSAFLESANPTQKELIEKMLDMVLSCDRQKKFLSLGEQFAFNTLAQLKIIF